MESSDQQLWEFHKIDVVCAFENQYVILFTSLITCVFKIKELACKIQYTQEGQVFWSTLKMEKIRDKNSAWPVPEEKFTLPVRFNIYTILLYQREPFPANLFWGTVECGQEVLLFCSARDERSLIEELTIASSVSSSPSLDIYRLFLLWKTSAILASPTLLPFFLPCPSHSSRSCHSLLSLMTKLPVSF